MKFEIIPAYEIPFGDQAKIFNRAFKGYLAGWHDMDADVVAQFVTAQAIDLCYSRFARIKGEPGSFGFVSRTGNVSRLTGMGTVPEARRTGAAAFLLSHLLDEAKQRGDAAMVLEVFEQNVQAVPLYRRNGFRDLMRLFGWKRSAGKANVESKSEPKEISLLAASQVNDGPDFPEIPWQVSRHIVPRIVDSRAYEIDNACVIISDPSKPPIRIHTMFGKDAAIKNLLGSLLTRFSHFEFFARQIFPEQLAGDVFEPLGFTREPLNQFLMRRDLR